MYLRDFSILRVAEGFIDCRCQLPRGSPEGVTWESVCNMPGRENKTEDQCLFGLTKDFCGCCNVCAKVGYPRHMTSSH